MYIVFVIVLLIIYIYDNYNCIEIISHFIIIHTKLHFRISICLIFYINKIILFSSGPII